MPKKAKGKFKPYYKSMLNSDGAEVYRNPSAALDGTDPKMSLQYIKDIFKGKIDDDVITMVFSECAYDVDQAVETLMKLSGEDAESISSSASDNFIKDSSNTENRSEKSSNVPPTYDESRLTTNCYDSFSRYMKNVGSPAPAEPVSLQETTSQYNSNDAWVPSYREKNMFYPCSSQSMFKNNNPNYYFPNGTATNYFYPEDNSQQFYSTPYFKNNIPNFVTPFVPSSYHYIPPAKCGEKVNFPGGPSKDNKGLLGASQSRKSDEKRKSENAIKSALSKIKSGSNVLIILRGLPGSGKSTLARKLKHSGVIFSTDDFFLHRGKYMFDWTKLNEAHVWNKKRTEKALMEGTNPVIIDNTNTEVWEMIPYVALSRKYAYEVLILEPTTPWKFKPKELSLRNRHGVTKEKIMKMLERYQHNVSVESILKNLDELNPPVNNLSDPYLQQPQKELSLPNRPNTSECVFPEVVVHQAEQPSDVIADNIGVSKSFTELNQDNDSFISCKNKRNSSEDATTTVSEKDQDIDEDLTIKNLEELKSLVEIDSEESQSQSSYDDVEKPGSEVSDWIAITEHDDDFHWKKILPSSESISSPSFNMNQTDSDALGRHSPSVSERVTNMLRNDCKSSRLNSTTSNLNSHFNAGVKKIQDEVISSCKFQNLTLANNLVPQNIVIRNEISKIDIKRPDLFTKNSPKSISMNDLNKINVVDPENHINESLKQNDKSSFLGENKKNLSISLPKSFTFTCKPMSADLPLNQSSQHESINENYEHSSEDNFKAKYEKEIDWDSFNEENKNDFMAFDGSENNCNYSSLNLELSAESKNANFKNTLHENLELFSQKRNEKDQIILPKPQRSEKKIKNIFKSHSLDHTEKQTCNVINLEEFQEWDSEEKEEASNPFKHHSPENTENFNILLSEPKPQRATSRWLTLSLADTPTGTGLNLTSKNSSKCNSVNDLTENKNLSSVSAGKKKPLFLKNASLHLDKNWSFPDYIPCEKRNEDSSSDCKILSVFTTDRTTQTETSDFVILQKLECGVPVATNYPVLSPLNNFAIEQKVERNLPDVENVIRIAKFDKSTSTEDLIEDVEDTEKLNCIQECFPDMSQEDVLYLLELCEGDESWLTHLLLESGHIYSFSFSNSSSTETDSSDSVSIKSSSSSSQLDNKTISNFNNTVSLPAGPDTNISGQVTDAKQKCSSIEDPVCLTTNENVMDSNAFGDKQVITTGPQGDLCPSNFSKLQFVLDSALAYQLEELFGPVVERDSNDALSSSQRIVQIDMKTAKLIHKQWKICIQKEESSCSNGSKEMQSKKKKKAKSKNFPPSIFSGHVNREPTTLSEIMDLEYALQIYKKEKLKKDTDVATKLKRQELYNLFPGADPTALDEIFESNNCSLTDSIKTLGEEYDRPTISNSNNVAEKIKKPVEVSSKKDIIKDFINSDWRSWVYNQGGNSPQEVIIPSITPTISTEALELRQQATEHFSQRQSFIKQAKEAYGRGMKEVASFYSQKGSEHQQKFKELNKLASQLIAKQRNDATSASTLDLHGLYVPEAIPLLDKFLRDWKLLLQNPQYSLPQTVSIITGQGLHSERGVAKLRPSVMTYLKKNGFRFSEVNRGVIEIYLNPE